MWVTGTRTGKSWQNVTFFFKVRSWYEQIKAKILSSSILAGKIVTNKISGFRRNLGCAPYAQSWVFFQNAQNTAFLMLYYSVCKRVTPMVFIWDDRGYLVVRFEYKTALERHLVGEKKVLVVFKKIELLFFFFETT